MDEGYTITIITFFGGLGFFLYGIMAMSESLQRVAGKRMKYYLENSTKTTFRGVISGAIFTALIQSSSGTTVLIIGLINAGLVNFRQAAALIIGSSIGTVITGFIIGIKLSNYSLIFVAIGMFLRMMGSNKIRKEYGRAIFGFGILFFGMNLMGESMYPLRDSAYFNQGISALDNNPFMGLILGTVLTGIIQSSSAMVGILQEMFNQKVISLSQLTPVLFGTAIGTTITAGFASLNAGLEAKKASAFNVLFNLTGALFFMPLFLSGFYLSSMETIYNVFIGDWNLVDPKMQVASLNAYFKMGYALAFLPFIGYLENLVDKVVKTKKSEEEFYSVNLDKSLLETPDLAYKNVNREIIHMVDLAKYSIDNALGVLNSSQNTLPILIERGEKIEFAIDSLRENIRDYTVKIKNLEVKDKDVSQDTFFIFDTIKSLERIGDYSKNIIKTVNYKKENNIFLPEYFYEKINVLGEIISDSLELCGDILETGNLDKQEKIEENSEKIKEIYKEVRSINVRKFSYYENVNFINYVVKNIIDNLFKSQTNINEIISNYQYYLNRKEEGKDEVKDVE